MRAALTRNLERIEIRINRGQTVQLDCTMIFGNEMGITNIMYIWSRIVGTGDALARVAVVEDTPTAMTEYQCTASGRVGKFARRGAIGTIVVTIRGNVYKNSS